MTSALLGELISTAKVDRAGDRDYPLLSMTMHDGLVDQSSKFKKRIASSNTSEYKVIRRGQLVVGFPIDEGVLDFQDLYDEGIVSPAYGVWEIREPKRVHAPYLGKFLRSRIAIAYYKGKLRGSTARRRSLPSTDFLALPVPLPPLIEQRRIAAVLDHADALRANRLQILAHLDDLTKSIFEDFFANEPLATTPLASIAEKVVVGHVGPTSEHFRATGVPFLRTGNVGHGQVRRADLAFITVEFHNRLKKSQLKAGDVLISRVISGEVRAAILPDDLDGANCANIIIVRPGGRIASEAVLGFLGLKSTQDRLLGRRVGSAQSVVNTTVLKELPIPVFSPGEQTALNIRLAQVAISRERALSAMETASELVASLQSRAFRGRL